MLRIKKRANGKYQEIMEGTPTLGQTTHCSSDWFYPDFGWIGFDNFAWAFHDAISDSWAIYSCN